MTTWGGLESGQHFRRWSTFDTALLLESGYDRGQMRASLTGTLGHARQRCQGAPAADAQLVFWVIHEGSRLA